MRVRFAVLLLATSAAPALAQGRGLTSEPSFWLSASGGYLWLATVADGATQSDWRFGDGFPWRVSLEKSLGGSASLGLAATWLRAPLVYASASTCGTCNAHALVAMYGPVLRFGGTARLHQVIELSAGVMQYGSFEEDATGTRLPPAKANRDFALSFAYGVGVAIARDWVGELVWTQISTFHERDNLPGNTPTHRQHGGLRAGLRIGY